MDLFGIMAAYLLFYLFISSFMFGIENCNNCVKEFDLRLNNMIVKKELFLREIIIYLLYGVMNGYIIVCMYMGINVRT